MDSRELIYFVEVVNQKSFTKAAEKLYVSQPALTMSIRNLEKDLGSDLLIRGRTDREMALTEAGEIVYYHARKIMNEFNLIRHEVSATKEEKIKLGLPSIIGEYLFPNLVKFISPDILARIEFVEVGSEKMRKLLDQDEISMALIGRELPIIDPTLEKHFIMRDSYKFFVSKKSPLAKRSSLDFKDLKSERFISLGKDYSQYGTLCRILVEEKMEDKIENFLIVNEIETAKSMIANNLGMGFMTSYSLGNNQDICLIPPSRNVYCYFYLVFKKNREFTQLENEVKENLIQANMGSAG